MTIADVKSCPPLGQSDHISVELTLTMSSVDNTKPAVTNHVHHHYRYLRHKGDYDNMACYLSGTEVC